MLELLDENADSEETMTMVSELVQEKVASAALQPWVCWGSLTDAGVWEE